MGRRHVGEGRVSLGEGREMTGPRRGDQRRSDEERSPQRRSFDRPARPRKSGCDFPGARADLGHRRLTEKEMSCSDCTYGLSHEMGDGCIARTAPMTSPTGTKLSPAPGDGLSPSKAEPRPPIDLVLRSIEAVT